MILYFDIFTNSKRQQFNANLNQPPATWKYIVHGYQDPASPCPLPIPHPSPTPQPHVHHNPAPISIVENVRVAKNMCFCNVFPWKFDVPRKSKNQCFSTVVKKMLCVVRTSRHAPPKNQFLNFCTN